MRRNGEGARPNTTLVKRSVSTCLALLPQSSEIVGHLSQFLRFALVGIHYECHQPLPQDGIGFEQRYSTACFVKEVQHGGNRGAFSCAHADASHTTRSFVISAFLLTTARWGRENSLPVTSAGARSTTPSSSCSLITASYSSSRSVFLSFRTRVFNLRKLPSLLFGKGGQFPFQGSPVLYHPSGERTNCSLKPS